jgi:hypothetical protein
MELEQFPSEHSVDIYLLNEVDFESGRALRFANSFGHRTERFSEKARRSLSTRT